MTASELVSTKGTVGAWVGMVVGTVVGAVVGASVAVSDPLFASTPAAVVEGAKETSGALRMIPGTFAGSHMPQK
jgi:tetrahydromethanopterin S-methyltransferase subunit C